jgi:hypothetical protein
MLASFNLSLEVRTGALNIEEVICKPYPDIVEA